MTVARSIAWEQLQSWLSADLVYMRLSVPLLALLWDSSDFEAEETFWLGLSDAEDAARSLICVSSFFARKIDRVPSVEEEVFGFLFLFPLDFVSQYFRTVGALKMIKQQLCKLILI